MSDHDRGYGDALGLRLLEELASHGHYIFTTAEAEEAAFSVGVAHGYLRQLLSRLVQGGWVLRLRRGLYATTGGLRGTVEVHPFAIATSLVTPSAISHLSALSYHGLTEQVPRMVTALTSCKIVTPSMREGGNRGKHAWEVGGLRYEYVSVIPEHFFGVEEVWADERFRVPITDRERTMFEGFASPRAFGGMGEVLGILEEHLQELDVRKLVDYALRYGKASVTKRLGWALERLGVPGQVLAPLREMPISGYRLLDPTRPRRGSYDRHWMIQDNLRAA